MKDVLSAQRDRFSTRKFKKEALTQFEVETLELACLNAPTAMNKQELKFSFITDPEIIGDMDKMFCEILSRNPEEYQAFRTRMEERGAENIFYAAPLVIVIRGENTQYSAVNGGIAVQNLALAAEALDLGSCIIGMARSIFNAQDELNFREQLNFAKDEIFHVAIAIGYKDMEKEPHEYSRENIEYFPAE